MSDFLLELRCEEIPARMQGGARADLEKLFRKEMDAAGVTLGEITVWSTPRRLALIARDLPQATAAVSEEVKGPRVGAPPQALEGFLRKTGLSEDQLTERDGVLFAITEKPGRATAEVLAEAIPVIVRAFPWPKSQRWGAASLSTESLRWVRPLSGIVAIFGDDLVECEVGGIRSGYATKGHRFHCPGEITIGSAADYAEKLRACHVIVDHGERQDLIRTQSRAVAEAAGLVLVEDEGLVIENAGLTEWPVPLLGRFDEAFLDVPPEVIQLTARTNQKYFVCEQGGKLANAFVCTANVVASDGGAEIVAGNRKVLAARLSDARFFWEQDRKVPLAEQAKKLERITFHEKLGTVADKTKRVASLAHSLIDHGVFGHTAEEQSELCKEVLRASEIAKSDLVTGMVGEFPELQGLMGSYYAAAQGETPRVCYALRDQYKPVGQNEGLPEGTVALALSLADKFDTITGFFLAKMPPSGSRDPYGLRRAALGAIRIITEHGLRFGIAGAVSNVAHGYLFQLSNADMAIGARKPQELDVLGGEYLSSFAELYSVINAFFADRLKVQQREAGVRHDLIDAVFALGDEDDLVRLLARVHALQAFVGTEDGTNLLAGYKRAANILKKEDFAAGEAISLSYTPEPAEKALIDALDAAGPRAAEAVAGEDFAGAMAALASLRAPIDAFFDEVTVNDPDHQKREYRLALLARFRDAVHGVADFSKIEG